MKSFRKPMIEFDRWIEIDLDKLAYNVKTLKSFIGPDTKLMAVLKADAYGHGAVGVAQTILANGAESIGVGGLSEGIELRDAGITAPILNLFSIPCSEKFAIKLMEYNITQTVYTMEIVKLLSKIAKDKSVKVHVKVDTGLRRVGIPYEHAVEFIKKIRKLPNIEIEGIFSTLAGGIDRDYMRLQFDRFLRVIGELDKNNIEIPLNHIGSSIALPFPEMYLDMMRLGITLYGLFPDELSDLNIDLRPVLQLKCKVDLVKSVRKGESVGYNRTYITDHDSQIATLPIGYYDGLGRRLSNKGVVLVKGRKVPIVGRVSLNHCLIDVTGLNVRIGDEVVLIGTQGKEKISVEDMASLTDTINYEIISKLCRHVPRVYLKNKKIFKYLER